MLSGPIHWEPELQGDVRPPRAKAACFCSKSLTIFLQMLKEGFGISAGHSLDTDIRREEEEEEERRTKIVLAANQAR